MKRSVYLAYVQKAFDEGKISPSAYDEALMNAEILSEDDEDDGVDGDINPETQKLMQKIAIKKNQKENSAITLEKVTEFINNNVDFSSLQKDKGISEFRISNTISLGVSFESKGPDGESDIYVYNLFWNDEYINISGFGTKDNPTPDDVVVELTKVWNDLFYSDCKEKDDSSTVVAKPLSTMSREFDNVRILNKYFYSTEKDGLDMLLKRMENIVCLYGDTLYVALQSRCMDDVIEHYSLFDLNKMVPVATDYEYPYGIYRYTENNKYYYLGEDTGLTRVVPSIILENETISESYFCDENGEYVDRENLFDRYDSFCCSMANDNSCYIYFEEDDWNNEEKQAFQELLKKMPKFHPFEPAELCEIYCYDNLPTYVTCPAYDAFTIPVFDAETNIFSYNHHDMDAETMDNVCVHLLDMFYENNRTEEEYYDICGICKTMNVPIENIINVYEQSENME